MQWWEVVKDNISAFMNQPFVLVLEGVIPLILTAVVLFAKTSVGRRVLNFLKEIVYSLKKTVENALLEAKAYFEKTDQRVIDLENGYKEKLESLQKEYETKIAIAVSFVNFYEDSFFAIAALIPNAKVQEKVKELKEQCEQKKEEIKKVVGVIYEDFDATVKKTEEEVREEYEDKIAFLEGQIKLLQIGLEEVKGGSTDVQREETENTDRGSETPQED